MPEPIYISGNSEEYMELVTHVDGQRVAVHLPPDRSIGKAEKQLLEKVEKIKMQKVKDGKTYYLKEDRRKNLKVLYEDGDKIGVVASIVNVRPDEKMILPNNQIYWTTEKHLLEGGLYTL